MTKILIDIPEDDYNAIRDNIKAYSLADMLFGAVQCGIVLPKGHGRLIDAEDVDNHIIGSVDLRDCPTIIEADKGE